MVDRASDQARRSQSEMRQNEQFHAGLTQRYDEMSMRGMEQIGDLPAEYQQMDIRERQMGLQEEDQVNRNATARSRVLSDEVRRQEAQKRMALIGSAETLRTQKLQNNLVGVQVRSLELAYQDAKRQSDKESEPGYDTAKAMQEFLLRNPEFRFHGDVDNLKVWEFGGTRDYRQATEAEVETYKAGLEYRKGRRGTPVDPRKSESDRLNKMLSGLDVMDDRLREKVKKRLADLEGIQYEPPPPEPLSPEQEAAKLQQQRSHLQESLRANAGVDPQEFVRRITMVMMRAKVYPDLNRLIAENPDIISFIASDLRSFNGDIDHALVHYRDLLLGEHEEGSPSHAEKQVLERFLGTMK